MIKLETAVLQGTLNPHVVLRTSAFNDHSRRSGLSEKPLAKDTGDSPTACCRPACLRIRVSLGRQRNWCGDLLSDRVISRQVGQAGQHYHRHDARDRRRRRPGTCVGLHRR
jgi:hypothetical protein